MPADRWRLPTTSAMRLPTGVRSGMKAKLAAAILALPLVIPRASNAALMSAQDLLTACSGDAVAKATCDGYLMAATDAVLRRESRGRGNGKVCVPETVTVDQVRAAVLDIGRQGRAGRAPAGLALVAFAMRRTLAVPGSRRRSGRQPTLLAAPRPRAAKVNLEHPATNESRHRHLPRDQS